MWKKKSFFLAEKIVGILGLLQKIEIGQFFFPTSNNLFWEQQFSLTCTEATLQAANTLIGKHHTNSFVFVYGQTDADRQTQNQSKLL